MVNRISRDSLLTSMYSIPNVFPLHDFILVRETPDDNKYIAEALELKRGEVVRTGRGHITRNQGLIPHTVIPGDSILFLPEGAVKLLHGDQVFYILPEWASSSILDRDPDAEEIPGFADLDIDKIVEAAIQEEEKRRRDPDASETQD